MYRTCSEDTKGRRRRLSLRRQRKMSADRGFFFFLFFWGSSFPEVKDELWSERDQEKGQKM